MKRGDVVSIGPHRIMCGDSQNPENVRVLTGGKFADTIFSSPPYQRQRDYQNSMECWDYMMRKVSRALPAHQKTQILFNLGLVYRDNSWSDYWTGWLLFMERLGFKRTGFYVCDKGGPVPGRFPGRLPPRHEFVFHLCRETIEAQKILPNKNPGKLTTKQGVRKADGARPVPLPAKRHAIRTHRVMDSVVVAYVRDPSATTDHPAVFPVALPQQFIETFSRPGQSVYDPFSGSGTTVLAAMKTGRVGFGMEISPEYAEQSVLRLRRAWQELSEPRAPGAA